MGKFRTSFCLCVLTLAALVRSAPYVAEKSNAIVAETEEKDNGFLGMATKTIPKSVIAINLQCIKHLHKTGENALFSAAGAYTALMMLHLAAGDKTRDELDKVFHITDKEINHEKLHEAASAVIRKIEHVSSGPDDQLPEVFFASGLFVQKGRSILDSYKTSLKKYYAANATNVDFLEHASEATDIINAWISNGTHKRIEKFYTNPLPATTVSILANALYFNGVWKDTFPTEQTKTEKFNTGTAEIEVSMMRNQKVVAYSHYDDLMLESIEIPYRGGEHVAVFSIPYANNTLKNFTEHVQKFNIRHYNHNSRMIAVDYKIPKLKVSWKNSLVNALRLEDIFKNADLSRMSAEKVPVSDIYQATDLEMDERGTIASAATVVSNTRLLTPPVTAVKQFFVDKSFLLTIVHKPTHMILFEGIVNKPQY